MKIVELLESTLQEIESIPPTAYSGGKGSLSSAGKANKFYPLPGGAGFVYSVENMPNPIIKIYDTNKQEVAGSAKPQKHPYEMWYEYYERVEKWENQQDELRKNPPKAGQKTEPALIGQLTLNSEKFPIKGALTVDAITVDEDYRNMGIAKALYGIVLSIMKRPLVAGSSQTPGGQKNWVSLSQIPGVEVYGYAMVEDDAMEEYTDTIMGKLGGDYMGSSGGYHFFRFNVKPNTTGNQLKTYVNQRAIQIYGEGWDPVIGGLYAIWTGR